MSLTEHTRLGSYEVLALLGTGGMSEVYRARDTRLDREVAIKVLHPAAATPRRTDRLLVEARAISRLNHPNICTLYDIGYGEGPPFLVMELLEGRTLANELERGPLPVDRALGVAQQIVGALDAAHSRGVIHRDLKPSNVMITATGVKLMDFGVAKLRERETLEGHTDSTDGIGLTEEGVVLGSCPYMSPEQLEGRDVDARADIFAFGVVLYETIVGRRPFHADNRAALAAAILTSTPPPISALSSAPTIPALLEQLVDRCLEKNREARWQSARDLAAALEFVTREPSAVRAAPARQTRVGSRIRLGVVAACVAVLAAGATYFGYRGFEAHSAPATRPAGRIMLVVLPFVNDSGDAGQDYLSDGMTEELIAQLGALHPSRLGVIARRSSMHYKGSTKRADEIAAELGADYLVEASLRKTGQTVRITARLIEVNTQSQIWTDQYDREASDVLRLQREVATAIVRRMAGHLTIEPLQRLPSTLLGHSSNPAAMDHYLRGRYQLARVTPEALWTARGHFEAATRIDRAYGRAYSGLADTYALLGSTDLMTMAESSRLGREAAELALQLDDTQSDAHVSLAAILADHYWDWKRAEWHYKRALDLAPNDVEALRNYSFYLGYTGRASAGLAIAERAVQLDPTSPAVLRNLGAVLNFARRFDDAIEQFERTIRLDPNAVTPHILLGFSYVGRNRPDLAVTQLERARALAGTRPDVVALHAHALARAGRKSEALKTLEDLTKMSKARPPSPFLVATVYVGLGDLDHAFEFLDRAVTERAWQLPMLKADHIFDRLRSDPRLPEILARLNLPN